MKAPDKIYIHARTKPYPSLTWSEVKEKNATNEEYIRKDALLEWAENWGKYKLRTDDGFLYAMELLINKLESL